MYRVVPPNDALRPEGIEQVHAHAPGKICGMTLGAVAQNPRPSQDRSGNPPAQHNPLNRQRQRIEGDVRADDLIQIGFDHDSMGCKRRTRIDRLENLNQRCGI